LQANNCLPALAGFDRQVDCLGRALRTSIDDIREKEKTTTGWGPEITSITLDNLKVTPANDATAALYDRSPRVNQGQVGGTWIFWNVWNVYAPKLDYAGPIGSSDGRWLGEPCVADDQCGAVEKATCATDYPGGLCTVKCNGQCPTQTARPETFCAKFVSGNFCLPVCNPAAPSCRDGYKCIRVFGVGAGESKHV
jgi:hypothetical protein